MTLEFPYVFPRVDSKIAKPDRIFDGPCLLKLAGLREFEAKPSQSPKPGSQTAKPKRDEARRCSRVLAGLAGLRGSAVETARGNLVATESQFHNR